MKNRSYRMARSDPSDDWVDGSWTVDCMCGVNFDDGEEMVNCDECGVWVHTRCSRYVKSEKLFACDKCKSKNSRNNDSEETEVAKLLVELPNKTMNMESSNRNHHVVSDPPRKRFRRWTDRPMDERVHVQGIPGGDPDLFKGLPASSIFTPQLWKCAGYVPKKFNFQYREFPCWDKNDEADTKHEQETESPVDKGANVLFALSKGTCEERNGEREAPLKETVKPDHGNFDIKYSKKQKMDDKNLFQPLVTHSSQPKKEDLGTSKDHSGKKRPRSLLKGTNIKNRGLHSSKPPAVRPASDVNETKFPEEKVHHYIKTDNLRDALSQERLSCGKKVVDNNLENNIAVNDYSGVAETKEAKADHDVLATVEIFSKSRAVAPRVVSNNAAREEVVSISGANLDRNGKCLASTIPVKTQKSKCPIQDTVVPHEDSDVGISQSFLQPKNNVETEVDGKNIIDNSKHVIQEKSKVNDSVLSNLQSCDDEAQGVGKISKVVSDCLTVKLDCASGDRYQSTSGELSPPPAFSQRKTVLCVGNSFSMASTNTERVAKDPVKNGNGHDMPRKFVKERSKSSSNSALKTLRSIRTSPSSDSKAPVMYRSSKASAAAQKADVALESSESAVHKKSTSSGSLKKSEIFNNSSEEPLSKINLSSAPSSSRLSDEELALLLHQELNSSPRVPRVPRARQAGNVSQLGSPTTTSMLKRHSTFGGSDHSLVSTRKVKNAKGSHSTHGFDDETKKPPVQRRREKEMVNESPEEINLVKRSIHTNSSLTTNSGTSSTDATGQNSSSLRSNSPRNSISDDDTTTVKGPHRTLPGLINEIMSKGQRMTYEELCNAVLPHWNNLRKHNGERYAYSSHFQAVLDCLRNRSEWAQLVDRGPKTNASNKKRRKTETDQHPSESEDKLSKKEYPKGKRMVRKRRRLALQGRGVKDVRTRSKTTENSTDDDFETYSNDSSEESVFSDEEDEFQGRGSGENEASASSDDTGTT